MKTIGEGGFGIVYQGVDSDNGNSKVAIKCENSRLKNPRLLYEYKIQKSLEGTVGIPKVIDYFEAPAHSQNRLVLELLGPSLQNQFEESNHCFTTVKICEIAIQLIKRIRDLHENGFIHRDIKPENILSGTGNNEKTLFLIDFGLAKRFKKNNTHIGWRKDKTCVGTPRFCSINAAAGKEQSRRDDLESFGYVLLYFLKGKAGLPWQDLDKKLTAKERFEEILRIKQKEEGTLFKSQPEEFGVYFDYCRKLGFEEEPNYSYLINLFENLIAKNKNKRKECDQLFPLAENEKRIKLEKH